MYFAEYGWIPYRSHAINAINNAHICVLHFLAKRMEINKIYKKSRTKHILCMDIISETEGYETLANRVRHLNAGINVCVTKASWVPQAIFVLHYLRFDECNDGNNLICK